VVIWWAWDRAADRRIAAFMAAVQARGEPVLFDDFAPKSIPAEQNAAIPLNQAVGLLSFSASEATFENTFTARLPLSATDQAALAKYLPGHAKEFALIRAARGRKEVEWGHRFTHPVYATMLPWVSNERRLSTLLQWSTLYHHTAGDDASALEAVRDMLMLAEAEEHEPPCLVVHMVAIGMQARAAEAAIRLAPTLQLGGRHGATRDDIRALILQFLDDAPLQQGMRRASFGERMAVLDDPTSAATAYGLSRLPGWKIWMPAPVLKLLAARRAADLSRAAQLTTQTNWSSAKRLLPPTEDRDDITPVQALARGDLLPYWVHSDRAVLQQDRLIAERRIAAIVLAARLYAIEHEGRLPASLQDLTPAYLPAGVPLDPFSADGGPLSYLPNHDPPIVYSVGYNGVDDGGSTKILFKRRSIGPDEWETADAVFPLRATGTVPATSPTTSRAAGPSQ
jgi:hypothetical protein